MSEQNPYAPVGNPVMAPPPGVMTAPPSGFAPPPPASFAPVPGAPYQTPGMALSELSFAPIPVDDPLAPVEVAAPPAPSLVSDVLPSGGVARRLSLGGGRTPLVGLLVVLLLLAGAAVYGSGILNKKKDSPVLVPKGKAPVASASASAAPAPVVVAPVTPSAVVKPKPVVKPLVGKPLAVTKANSRTYSTGYTITIPTGWTSKLKNSHTAINNGDLIMLNEKTGQVLTINSLPQVVSGPVTADDLSEAQASVRKVNPTAKFLPGTVNATIAGVPALGWDMTATISGQPYKVRTMVLRRGTVGYVVVWASPPAAFSTSLTTFNQLVASVKFAK
ncbi:MAG: hypothetical protein ABI912_03860 [Actinomycetota bacterium]